MRIEKAEVVAYPELGPEALYRMRVRDFPCIVINDIHGGDLYEKGKRKYRKAGPHLQGIRGPGGRTPRLPGEADGV